MWLATSVYRAWKIFSHFVDEPPDYSFQERISGEGNMKLSNPLVTNTDHAQILQTDYMVYAKIFIQLTIFLITV